MIRWNRFFAVLLLVTAPLVYGRETRDVVGVVHARGLYTVAPATEDYLVKGAGKIRTMGSRVIKLWLTNNPRLDYPFANGGLPAGANNSVVTVANSTSFQSVFGSDFKTFILMVETKCGLTFADGLSATEQSCEDGEIYNLARHLLVKYGGSGKTFVIQNWETDNKLDQSGAMNMTGFNAAKDFFTVRQKAVNRARTAPNTPANVTVLHAAEVNWVQDALRSGLPRVVNSVLPALRSAPYVEPDLYSYSAWDFDGRSASTNPSWLVDGLNYIASQTQASRDRIYVGEYGEGWPVDENEQRDLVAKKTQAALAWGVRYAIYWQVFNNEPGAQFWLIKPDGTPAVIYSYFADLMKTTIHRLTLRNLAYNRYLNVSGTGTVNTSLSAATFVLLDLNGGTFARNDRAALLQPSGQYVTAQNGGGGTVTATAWLRGSWEEFIIQDDQPTNGVMESGDTTAFIAPGGQDVQALSNGTVRADGIRPSPDWIDFDQLWQMSWID